MASGGLHQRGNPSRQPPTTVERTTFWFFTPVLPPGAVPQGQITGGWVGKFSTPWGECGPQLTLSQNGRDIHVMVTKVSLNLSR